MIKTIELHSHALDANGRNGWFRPVKAELMDWNPGCGCAVRLSFSSKRYSDTEPIVLVLTAADARALGAALLEVQ